MTISFQYQFINDIYSLADKGGKNKDLPSHGIIPFWILLVPLGPANAFRDVERVQITCGFLSIFLKHLILIFQVNRTENNIHNRKVHKKTT